MSSKPTQLSMTLSMPSSTPWLPKPYMKKAVKFLLEHAAAALFLDPGLGKTSITMAALKLLIKRKLVRKVLVLAPLQVCQLVWRQEAAKWTDFNGLRLVLLHGPDKDDLLEEDADIFIINYEGLDWLLNTEKVRLPSGKKRVTVDLKRWRKLGFDTLVIDELSKFKHGSTDRFKAWRQVVHTFSRRWGLTGSPAANGLHGLWGQCFALDEGRSLGKYVTHYRREYFLPDRSGFGWVLQEGAEARIYARVAPLALRMAAADYLQLPERTDLVLECVLPPLVLKAYRRLYDDLVVKLDSGKVTAATAGVATMKCRQVANGAVYLDQEVEALLQLPSTTREVAVVHDVKLKRLEDLVDELQGQPLLVVYEFHHDLERLQKLIPKAVHLTSGKQAPAIVDSWNRGEIEVMLVQPQSAAYGLNLQGACAHLCWFGVIWDYELYDQLVRRIWRQGNKAIRIIVYHLVAQGTVDERIIEVLGQKAATQQAFFDWLIKKKTKRHR